jgi:ferric-dicitrate binding protein FerR (iron transport regulator)
MKCPFLVKGNFGLVKVLGTQFNVKAYENEPFQTTLVNGMVTFRTNNGSEFDLKPGTQIFKDDGKYRTRNVETDLVTSWKDGKLIFREEPLGKMVAQLERWYNVRIELKGTKLKNLRFTGTIEMESFSEVLELIKITTPIKYSFDRHSRILTIDSK